MDGASLGDHTGRMPTTVARSIDLSSPPEDVWAVLGEFGAISSWAPNVDHSVLLEGSPGIGGSRRIQTGSSTLVETVTAWDPPSTLSYDIEGLPQVVRHVSNTWHVYGHDGGSRVTLASVIDTGSRPPGPIVARVVGRLLGRASEQMLTGLRNRLLAIEGAQERRSAERTAANG